MPAPNPFFPLTMNPGTATATEVRNLRHSICCSAFRYFLTLERFAAAGGGKPAIDQRSDGGLFEIGSAIGQRGRRPLWGSESPSVSEGAARARRRRSERRFHSPRRRLGHVRSGGAAYDPTVAMYESRDDRPDGDNMGVDLARISWLLTVGVCLIAVLVLVLQGYLGYAAVTFAVALSAAINLI